MEKQAREREGTPVTNHKVKLNILAFCTVLIWATAFPLTKVATESFSVNCLGLFRLSIASVFLIIMGLFTHIQKPVNRKALFWLVLSGILGFSLYLILFNTGILTLTSATSSIIMASTPIMTAIASLLVYGKKIKISGWVCIGFAFIGVAVLLLWNGVLSINIGIIWTLGAAVVFCLYNLISLKLSAMGHTAIETVTYSMIFGAVSMLPFLPQTLTEISAAAPSAILVTIYLGFAPSAVAYVLWAKALQYADHTNEVTNYMFVTPLLAALLGFVILGELPDIGTVIGGIIIISSLILFNKADAASVE